MKKFSKKKFFYVYILFRPWNGLPCYVGKGKGKRWLNHERFGVNHSNIHLARIIAKANGVALPKIKMADRLTEKQALCLEVELIKSIGRGKNGPLVNLTDGGDGQSGWVPSQLTRNRIKVANTGKKLSEATKAAMSAAGRGRKKTQAHKQAIGKAHKGRIFSVETLAKMKASSALRWARKEEHEKIKAYHRNMTPEQKADRGRNISRRTKIAMRRPEIRQRFELGLVNRGCK